MPDVGIFNNIGYIPEERKELVKLVLELDETSASKAFGYVSALVENGKK